MGLGLLAIILLISLGVLVWMGAMLISDLSACAYVPTPTDHVNKALALFGMKPGKRFADLGSGDGRLVILAAGKYGVEAVGFEINPWLVLYSRIRAKLARVKKVKFSGKNLWTTNLNFFNYIYCYLSPGAMKKLSGKFDRELKKDTVVVSKAFEIKEWKHKLVKRSEIGGKNLWVYKI